MTKEALFNSDQVCWFTKVGRYMLLKKWWVGVIKFRELTSTLDITLPIIRSPLIRITGLNIAERNKLPEKCISICYIICQDRVHNELNQCYFATHNMSTDSLMLQFQASLHDWSTTYCTETMGRDRHNTSLSLRSCLHPLIVSICPLYPVRLTWSVCCHSESGKYRQNSNISRI